MEPIFLFHISCRDAPILDILILGSNHMCSKKELFSQLDESIRDDINFGNKSKVLIMGKGNVKICSKDGTDVTIADVFFVLNLFWNLLSMGQLIEK